MATTLINATSIDGLAGYVVGETDGGWGYRCLDDAAVAFDAIMEHMVYATRDDAIAGAMAEHATAVENRRSWYANQD